MDRKEYKVNLKNNLIWSFKKETKIEKLNTDNDALLMTVTRFYVKICND